MKPEPKTVKIVCTACGLDWEAHGAKPTLAKCVTLLRAELAKRTNVVPFHSTSSGVTSGYWQGVHPLAAVKKASGDA